MNRPPPPPAPARAVIGITGHKGSGKDTAAEGLAAQGFTHVKLADALKAMLRKLLACQGADAEMIRRMIDGDLKEVPTPLLEAVAEIRVMEDRIEAMRESLASAIGAARDAYVADIAAFIQAAACGELEPLETDS